MIHIGNLTNAQALACAEAMRERGRYALCNQILEALEARIAAARKAAKKPRKRVAQTGELA